MNRIFGIAACLIFVLTPYEWSFGQDFQVQRYWRDSTGKYSIEASLIEYSRESVRLKKSSEETVDLPLNRLSEEDKDFLIAVESIKQTRKQAELLAPHLSQVVSKPAGTIEIINALKQEYPLGVAAGIYGGCVYGALGKDRASVSRSKRCLEDSIKNLEKIELQFPGLFSKTHAVALNNRALVAIREGSVLGAVNFLRKAAELSDEIPFAVYHNASLLLNSKLDLGSSKTQLASILAKGHPESSDTVPNYLMYTLAHDPLFAKSQMPSTANAPGAETARPSPGKFLVASGSGFLIGPDLVLTNAHVAEGCSSFRVSNDSGLSINAVVLKQSQSESIDLAVLRLETSVNLAPLPLRLGESSVPALGEQLVVLGYPRPDAFERSLTASGGVTNKLVEEKMQVLHDASTDPGNSGGPCLDMKGNVLGVHCAGSTVAKNARNYAVSPLAMDIFLRGVPGFTPVALANAKTDMAGVVSLRKDSVFYIECFSDTLSRPSASSQPATGGPMEKHFLIPDHSCLVCTSKGYIGCGRCANGYIYTPVRTQVGTTTTGTPIMGTTSVKKKCSACSRGGKIPCPNCRGTGRIK